ncbi:MAG: flavin reductase family protein [Desulfurococcaceae archaeon]
MRVYLIVSGRLGEEVNVMAADWVTPISSKPFLVGVAIAPKRYTHKLVSKYGEFVVAVPSAEMLRDVWIAGTESGPDKLERLGLSFAKGKAVGTPIVREALANLECRVVDRRDYGDHTLFVGEVLDASYSEGAFRGEIPVIDAGFLLHVGMSYFASTAGLKIVSTE